MKELRDLHRAFVMIAETDWRTWQAAAENAAELKQMVSELERMHRPGVVPCS